MKKLLFAVLMTVSLISSAFANPTEQKVSYIVRNAFTSNFRSASNVQWKVSDNYAKATFVTNNKTTEAFYSLDGNFIGTSQAITIENLPTWAKRSFAKKYGSYTVKEAIQFDGTEETSYFISADNEKQAVIIKAVNGTTEVFKSTDKG